MRNLLYDLAAYAKSDIYPFHMPGHKRNLSAAAADRSDSPFKILEQAAGLDITEIDGFDNLHAPEEILKEALERAARLYGADETFYSVNGSTAGLLTAISAAVPENSRVIIARNCHKAVYHALYLRHLQPVYLYPEVIGALSAADALTPEAVLQVLEENPDIKAVILTSPTYDGICADVARIAEIVHDHDAVLIVDAAHGAHFGFHPDFPENPVKLGADLTVVSLHKTLPAMTQTALLHVRGERVDRQRLKMFSGMYQTSSPSYFFMAGMDTCIRLIEEKGAALWGAFWQDRAAFLKKTEKLTRLKVFTAGQMPKMSGTAMDAGKILIESGKTGLTGQQIYDILLTQYHLQLEMAAGSYATAIVTCCDKREGWERLAEALLALDRSDMAAERKCRQLKPYPELEAGMSLFQALDAPKESCLLSEAEGRIAGGFINLYPPGIPIVVPGELLSAKVIMLITGYMQTQLPVQGAESGSIPVVAI